MQFVLTKGHLMTKEQRYGYEQMGTREATADEIHRADQHDFEEWRLMKVRQIAQYQ